MPFKVVQTIEDGEVCLSVVPSGWESKGILRWPKKHLVGKLSQVETSLPAENWERMNCVNKREFKTRAEADSELDRMENISDTEVEDFRSLPPPTKKAKKVTKSNNSFVPPNFNSWINSSPPAAENLPASEHNESVGMAETVGNRQVLFVDPPCPNAEGQSNDSSQFVYMLDEEPVTSADPSVLKVLLENSANANILTAILENQKLILENQNKQFQGMARMQTTIDYIMEVLTADDQPHTVPGPMKLASENRLSPVNSLEELIELESSLTDGKREQELSTGMAFICGKSGKANGMDMCYKLVDYFFTREFMTLCSWTGAARLAEKNGENRDGVPSTSDEGKISLKTFKKVRKLFLNLILRADVNFSEVECEKFFKTVMKNSKQRLAAKCQTSKHKDRPKDLKYKPRKQNDENQPNVNLPTETNGDGEEN